MFNIFKIILKLVCSTDIGTGMKTNQSSTYYDRSTSTNRSSRFPVSPDWPDCRFSYSQTRREDRPWWAVQLSGRFTVSRVYIKAGMYTFVVEHYQ